MGKFKEVIKEYADHDGSKDKMWKTVELCDDVMEMIAESHPEKYRDIENKMHVMLYGKHFDEMRAKALVYDMMHTDKRGALQSGEHFSLENAKMIKEKFVPSENCYDVYVALNATWHDFDALYSEWFSAPSDQHFIKTAISFWFEDEDYPCSEKVWCYFN